jgi:HD-like signal output (HDOD) protein
VQAVSSTTKATPTGAETAGNGAEEHPAHARVIEFVRNITDDLARAPLNLPGFPDIVPRIRKALEDPNSTADDVVRIAGTEPRLTARLLQTANSVVFNTSGEPFRNLRQAVTRLGHHLVQSATMAFAIQQMKAAPALRRVSTPLDELWEKSVAVASICQVLARRLGVPADKVFLTGLLHGIGYFYILVRAAGALSPSELSYLLSHEAARCHPAIGRAVLEKWDFEPVVCEAVGSQLQYDRASRHAADITDVLIASVVLADIVQHHPDDLTRCAGVASFARLNLSPDELHAVIQHTQLTLGALRESLGC